MSENSEQVTADPEILNRDEVRTGLLGKAKRLAGKLPFVRDAVAMYFALRDPETPMWSKAIIAGALLYFLAPIDLIPDVMVGIGFTDDAAVVAAALKTVSSIIGPQHQAAAEAFLQRG